MRKQYKKPKIKVLFAQLDNMIASSPGVNGSEKADPNEALTGTDFGWEDDNW